MKRTFFTFIFIFFTLSQLSAQVRLGYKRQADRIDISYSYPKEYEIGGIDVIGTKFLDENALIALSGLKVGDKITVPGEEISSAIKKLWKQGIIGDVAIYAAKVEGNKIFLNIELTERPRVTRISFEGVNNTQEKDLDEKLAVKGRVMSDALLKNTEMTVREHFVEKGFYNTEVDIIQQEDTLISNGVRLKVKVDKKKKVRVRNIYVVGNEAFSDTKVKNKMKSTNEKLRFFNKKDEAAYADSYKEEAGEQEAGGFKKWINDRFKLNIFRPSKFVGEKFEEDKEALIAFYNSEGYRDAKIVNDTVFSATDNTVDVLLHIEEGKRYYFRDITWTGNYVHNDEVLSEILGVDKGDVYDMESLNTRLNYNPTGEDVSALYMDNGYLFFRVNPVEVKVDEDSIDVEMRIYEGPQATINKIILKGNDRTNDHVVLREIRTLPGEKFSRADLIRTQRELSQMGYFDPEQIGMNPVPNPADGTVDIEYDLVEKPSDQIELSGGWGGYFGFVGTLGVQFTNFSAQNLFNFEKWRPLPVGDGQMLSLRMQANGRAYQRYSVTFSEPWLGGRRPNAFTVSLSHSVQRGPDSEALEAGDIRNFDGRLGVTSATVSLGRRVTWPDDFFTFTNSVSYLLYSLDDYARSGVLDFPFRDGTANNFTYNMTIARNSVNNPMYPAMGSTLSLNISLTPPYSLFRSSDFYETSSIQEVNRFLEYNKWMFDGSFYVPITGGERKLVLHGRSHLGFIGRYNTNAPFPPFERFVMGGSGLSGQNFLLGVDVIALRGYEDNTIVPEEINYVFDESAVVEAETEDRPLSPVTVTGGVIYNKFVMELRYPLTLSPAATIYVLGFAEAGNTWNNYQEWSPSNLKRSAGVGARIFMPAFGLIGIDWGYGFDEVEGYPNASGSQFTFTIGQQIR
jgi:outer membrane protein insertion porin family